MATHLLFEDDGAFRAGTVLSASDSSSQVELPSGKRVKVKSSHVLLRFAEPAPAQLVEKAQQAADEIDIDFLWEAAPQDEFAFDTLARDYFGHDLTPVQSAALLLRLHSAPMYFYRKGRGRYRPAPPETLRAARAAVERRRQQDELRQQMVDELVARRAPPPIAERAIGLLVRPDRASLEVKALEQAAAAAHTTPLKLLIETGAIASPYRWHVDSFLALHFPRGTGFGDVPVPPANSDDLPEAAVHAFSIDDSATTEIDDAFSVRPSEGGLRIGIHIAAPAVTLARDHALDPQARARMSTVYAPGIKLTMLPEPWVESFSLNQGRSVPVLSLYLQVDPDTWRISGSETRVERVRIRANLRHDRLDEVVTERALADRSLHIEFAEELAQLHSFARDLVAEGARARGRAEPVGRVDYSIELDGEDENARVSVRARRRGAPLDLIVAELMILANSHWGRALADRRIAAIYRSQSLGRVRMSTSPARHEGIGVEHYAWCTSPLRRYVDLVNQRQLLALVRGDAPPYAGNDAELFAVVSAFDATYGAYDVFQQKMEHYWSLRWLQQQQIVRSGATVLKGEWVRFDDVPLVTRIGGLPPLPRGQRVEIDILGHDLLEVTLEARLHRVLAAQTTVDELEDADDADVADVADTDATSVAAEPVPAGDSSAPPEAKA